MLKQWALSVAGIAILSVLADVILPVGQTRKYVKTVIGVVVTAVLAQPVLSLGDNLNFSYSEVVLQEQYLQYVATGEQNIAAKFQSGLEEVGFLSPSVTYSETTESYSVFLTEKRTEFLEEKAHGVAASIDCGNVNFFWNNTA